MQAILSIWLAFLSLSLVTGSDGTELPQGSLSSPSTAVVNTQIHTIVNFKETQVYVYNALSNEKENKLTPQKWIFYYVPLTMAKKDNSSKWAVTAKNELRVRILLGNLDFSEIARKEIAKKFPPDLAHFAKFWSVAPLMIDSLSAYVVKGSSSPVEGVHPFHIVHPNALTITARFECSSRERAAEILQMIMEDEYDIEVAFFFGGFRQVTTNLISITGDQLRAVISKTVADGGNSNAQYIHRKQAAKFVNSYATNVQSFIYRESPGNNTTMLFSGLMQQFMSLLQQGMVSSAKIMVDAKVLENVWSMDDLTADKTIQEVNKNYTYNEAETQSQNHSDVYFDQASSTSNSSSSKDSTSLNVEAGGVKVGGSTSKDRSQSKSGSQSSRKQDKMSLSAINRKLDKEDIQVEWTGEKFVAKSFRVFRLTDLFDHLQIALIAKELTAEKTKGAVIRTVGDFNVGSQGPATINVPSILPGEVRIFTGVDAPDLPWMLCEGQALSRVQYPQLFAAIKEQYGKGDGRTTFNLPDFRGRQPVGLDQSMLRVEHATHLGQFGGKTKHVLRVEEMPSHMHDKGTLSVGVGGRHSHSYEDPGHDHGGRTGPHGGTLGGRGNMASGRYWDAQDHTHTINRDTTHIRINQAGEHTHNVQGKTGSAGANGAFSIVNPFLVVRYIIYTGD